MLIAISTSGNLANVASALIVAKSIGMSTLGLTGETGGKINPFCDVLLRVPATTHRRHSRTSSSCLSHALFRHWKMLFLHRTNSERVRIHNVDAHEVAEPCVRSRRDPASSGGTARVEREAQRGELHGDVRVGKSLGPDLLRGAPRSPRGVRLDLLGVVTNSPRMSRWPSPLSGERPDHAKGVVGASSRRCRAFEKYPTTGWGRRV